VKREVAQYQCDNCKRTTYTDKSTVPTGWRSLILWVTDNEKQPEATDICDSCSEAVFHSLGRRKAIERGGPEKEVQEVYLDAEQCGRQTAMLLAPRVSKSSTDDGVGEPQESL